MVPLTTDRLQLRSWTIDDADFVLDLYSRWEVQRYIGLTPRLMQDRVQALATIQRWQAFQDRVGGMWAVAGRESGQLLGVLLLKGIPSSGGGTPSQPPGDTEIGWHFHPDAWGHGYASEAAAAVFAQAFAAGLDRVVAVTNPLNVASQKVCLRIGMQPEGQTDRYYDATCELFVAVPGANSASLG